MKEKYDKQPHQANLEHESLLQKEEAALREINDVTYGDDGVTARSVSQEIEETRWPKSALDKLTIGQRLDIN